MKQRRISPRVSKPECHNSGGRGQIPQTPRVESIAVEEIRGHIALPTSHSVKAVKAVLFARLKCRMSKTNTVAVRPMCGVVGQYDIDVSVCGGCEPEYQMITADLI
jgi:hypothetical protein